MGAIYKNGILYSGGGGSGESIIYLTKAEYDALDPPVEGQLYGITDWSGDAVKLINDTTTSTEKVWSSSKVDNELDKLYDGWKKNGAYNLCPNEDTSTVIQGVTFIVNSDKSVTVSTGAGGATGNAFFLVATGLTLKAGTYKLVGCPSGGSIGTYYLYCNSDFDGAAKYDYGTGREFTLSSDGTGGIRIFVGTGTVITTPITFKPMITTDLNATYDDYEPYAKTNRELTEDWNTVTGPLSFTYASGLTSSDILIYAYRYGKIVVISFICQNRDLLPAAAWNNLAIASGFPKPVSDGGNYTQSVHGRTVTNNIPFVFTITSIGQLQLRKQSSSTSSDSMQAYEGGIIVYLTTD